MITPYLRYRLRVIRHNAASMQHAARIAEKQWLPHLSGHVPQEVLKVIVLCADGASCRTVYDSEHLAAAGFASLILTRPVVDPDALTRLSKVAASAQMTVVVDHFRQAELLSHAMITAGTSAEILIDVDLGQQTTGVRPGPDSVRLAAAVNRLSGVRLRGVFVDDRNMGLQPDGQQASGFGDVLAIARHCQRMIQADNMACDEIVTGQAQFNAAWQASGVSVVLGDPLIPSDAAASSADETENHWSVKNETRKAGSHHGAMTDAGMTDAGITDGAITDGAAVELVARVLSRPSLEWCVVDVGAADLGEIDSRAVDRSVSPERSGHRNLTTRPRGGSLLHVRTDVSTLALSCESLDLRIGDEVVIVTNLCALRHNLPTAIDE